MLFGWWRKRQPRRAAFPNTYAEKYLNFTTSNNIDISMRAVRNKENYSFEANVNTVPATST